MMLRLRSAFDRQLFWQITVVFLWLGASCDGLAILGLYASSQWPTLRAAASWPHGNQLRLSTHDATLILFAHPRCPCTRASLGELEKIVARFPDSFTSWVVFLKPAGVEEGGDQTDLRKSAAAIPGVHVVTDPDGLEARRFSATMSGQVFLYSPKGELLFNGGITLSRGHAGDNPGRSAVESSLSLEATVPACRRTPVFGCPIAAFSEQKPEVK